MIGTSYIFNNFSKLNGISIYLYFELRKINAIIMNNCLGNNNILMYLIP